MTATGALIFVVLLVLLVLLAQRIRRVSGGAPITEKSRNDINSSLVQIDGYLVAYGLDLDDIVEQIKTVQPSFVDDLNAGVKEDDQVDVEWFQLSEVIMVDDVPEEVINKYTEELTERIDTMGKIKDFISNNYKDLDNEIHENIDKLVENLQKSLNEVNELKLALSVGH